MIVHWQHLVQVAVEGLFAMPEARLPAGQELVAIHWLCLAVQDLMAQRVTLRHLQPQGELPEAQAVHLG